MFEVYDTLKRLVEIAQPSGFEQPQAKLLAELAAPYVDEVYTDTLGNVICHKKGPGKKIMVPAHMDVIGFIVIHIDDEGFLRFAPLGGHSPVNLINTPVIFENGVRGCIRPDCTADLNTPYLGGLRIDSLYIDIGAADKAEAERMVKPGMAARFDFPCEKAAGGNIITPYADDLIACVTLLMAMERAKKTKNDMYYVFTVQEERGLRGARVAARHIAPDVGIAVDVGVCSDLPGENKGTSKTHAGGGALICVKNGGYISNLPVRDRIRELADAHKIPWQDEIMSAGSTDSAAIQTSRGGVQVGGVSVPNRYAHSSNSVFNIEDAENVAKLITVIAETEF